MEYKDILWKVENHVGTITLNRPEAFNAISDTMRKELREVIEIINTNPDIRIVVITGSGKAFCAGGDIKLMKEKIESNISFQERLTTYRNDVAGMVKLIKSIKQPVIAALNGATFGAGCSIAMLCDMRIAADNIKFGMPFGKRGLIPDWGATYYLPRLIGTSKAIELISTGRTFDAQTALEIGFVNKIVPHEELEETVNNYCQDILQSSPLSVMAGKAAIYASMESEIDTALELEANLQSKCYLSEDHKEGVDCFIEKRDAVFTGK